MNKFGLLLCRSLSSSGKRKNCDSTKLDMSPKGDDSEKRNCEKIPNHRSSKEDLFWEKLLYTIFYQIILTTMAKFFVFYTFIFNFQLGKNMEYFPFKKFISYNTNKIYKY